MTHAANTCLSLYHSLAEVDQSWQRRSLRSLNGVALKPVHVSAPDPSNEAFKRLTVNRGREWATLHVPGGRFVRDVLSSPVVPLMRMVDEDTTSISAMRRPGAPKAHIMVPPSPPSLSLSLYLSLHFAFSCYTKCIYLTRAVILPQVSPMSEYKLKTKPDHVHPWGEFDKTFICGSYDDTSSILWIGVENFRHRNIEDFSNLADSLAYLCYHDSLVDFAVPSAKKRNL
jgi:hypothetical protein